MVLDSRFIDILCCPVSKCPVRNLSKSRLQFLNQAILRGEVQTVGGQPVAEVIKEALITEDGKVIYRVDEGIPVLLPDEAIGTTQFHQFPS